MFLGDFVNCIHLPLVYVKGFADNIESIFKQIDVERIR